MTTSGTTTFNLTTAEIIQEALELLGVVRPGQSVAAEDYTSCLRSLNMMVKSWQQNGMFVTHEAESTVFLVPGTAKYILGGTSASRTGAEPVIETKTISDSAAAATSIDVIDTTDITALDKIGIVLDDGDVHWTTVTSITDSDTLVLTTALPSAAASGNMVFIYTTSMGRPLEISYVAVRNSGGTDASIIDEQHDVRINEINKVQYKTIYNKGQQGTPVQFFQDKQNDHTSLYVWPTGSIASERLKVVYKRIIEDFTNSDDIADLPPNWSACFAYNLAAYVAPKYGKEQKAGQAIAPIASTLLQAAMSDVQEKSPFSLTPGLN